MVELFFSKHIDDAILKAERLESKLPSEILSMSGMSGIKTRHFYNNLLSLEDARYLEVGTWKGSSVCSAMYGNKALVVCVDNWSQFQGPKLEFLNSFEKFKGENNASFIEKDAFEIVTTALPKFNMYMYDGDHSELSHYLAVTHFLNAMDDVFIYVVDDWNWSQVREGTMKAIAASKLEIVHQREIRLTNDNSHTPPDIAKATWWNGIWAAVLRKTVI
jgi:hypothetical protein